MTALTVPYTFANQFGNVPASELDQNFSTLAAAITPFALATVFGVKANGVTDDAPALQAAMNSLNGGGVVYLPFGATILIKETLVVPEGVSLVGYNTTIKAGAAIFQMLNITTHAGLFGNRYSVISGLVVDGMNVATEGVYIGLAVQVAFKNVTVQNIVASGAPGTVGLGCAWVLDATQNCTFDCTGTNTNCATALLVINGAAGNFFMDHESASTVGALHNGYFTIDTARPGYAFFQSGPLQNTFVGGRFEYGNAPTIFLLDQGENNKFYNTVFVNDGSGPAVQFNSGALCNWLNECIWAGAGAGGRTCAFLNNGFHNGIRSPFVENYPSGANVIQVGNQTFFVGNWHFNDPSYKLQNTAGNAAANFIMNLAPIYLGAGDITTYTAGAVAPGMLAYNDTGRLWLRDKTAWSEVGVPPENVLPIVGAVGGTPFPVTIQLPGPGVYEVDVVAKNGDSNHGRHNVFSVLYSPAPTVNPPGLCAAMLATDQVWGSVVTALSASVTDTGLVTIDVTFSSSGNGNVNVAFRQVGYF